jgi:hypothetical protein
LAATGVTIKRMVPEARGDSSRFRLHSSVEEGKKILGMFTRRQSRGRLRIIPASFHLQELLQHRRRFTPSNGEILGISVENEIILVLTEKAICCLQLSIEE